MDLLHTPLLSVFTHVVCPLVFMIVACVCCGTAWVRLPGRLELRSAQVRPSAPRVFLPPEEAPGRGGQRGQKHLPQVCLLFGAPSLRRLLRSDVELSLFLSRCFRCITGFVSLILKALQGRFVIPDFATFTEETQKLFSRCRQLSSVQASFTFLIVRESPSSCLNDSRSDLCRKKP